MCDCDTCKLWKRVRDLRQFLLGTGPTAIPHVETLDHLYNKTVHEGMDLDHVLAIVDNQWPSAETYMKSKGWVREEKESV